MSKTMDVNDASSNPVQVFNTDGEGRYVLICDHASNKIPARLRTLGLENADLLSWRAYDPHALKAAKGLAERLDAPLVYPDVSRLVINCNRPLTAPDLIAGRRGTLAIPGNQKIGEEERIERIEGIYNVYHETIDAVIGLRGSHLIGLIAVHTVETMAEFDAAGDADIMVMTRPGDAAFADAVERLREDGEIAVAVHEIGPPGDIHSHTMQRHAYSRGVPGIEFHIRNDQIACDTQKAAWIDRLVRAIRS